MKQGLLVNRRMSIGVIMVIVIMFFVIAISGIKRFHVWPQITTFFAIEEHGNFTSSTNTRAIKDEIEKIIYRYNDEEFESLSKKWSAIQPDSGKSQDEVVQAESELLGDFITHLKDKPAKGLKLQESSRPRQEDGPNWSFDRLHSWFLSTLDDASLLASRYAHMPRASLMYPIIALAAMTKTNIHLMFSFFCILGLLLISYFLNQTMRMALSQPHLEAGYLILIFFASLSILMNGRMLFGLLASSLLLWMHYRHERTRFSAWSVVGLELVALWFSSVSTGLFGGVFLATLAWAIMFSGRHRLVSFIAPALVSPYFIVAIVKNLAYYDYNVLTLFYKHGLVRALGSWKAALGSFVAIAMIYRLRRLVLPRPFFCYPLAFCGAIFFIACFGHTTATAAIPGLILLLVLKLQQLAPSSFAELMQGNLGGSRLEADANSD